MAREYVNATEAARITGLSIRTITQRLADATRDADDVVTDGPLAGARKVHLPGSPWHWEIPRAALDTLQRSARPSDDLLAVLEELRATVTRLEERMAALEARGARQQAALPIVADTFHVSPLAPSDFALGALQGHIGARSSQKRGVGGQDVPPKPGAVRLGRIMQEHGVISESGAVSSYWIAQLKAARSLAGVYTQPSQRNRDVLEYWVLRSDRGAFVHWLIEHPNAKAHACDDPACPCSSQLPPALSARPEVPTVKRPDLAAVLAGVREE